MQLFVVVRDDVTIAEGVVFAAGATVVHSRLRRDRDSVTRFASLADVKQWFRGCEVKPLPCTGDPLCRVEVDVSRVRSLRKRTDHLLGHVPGASEPACLAPPEHVPEFLVQLDGV
jgi:hypothetical protein